MGTDDLSQVYRKINLLNQVGKVKNSVSNKQRATRRREESVSMDQTFDKYWNIKKM